MLKSKKKAFQETLEVIFKKKKKKNLKYSFVAFLSPTKLSLQHS